MVGYTTNPGVVCFLIKETRYSYHVDGAILSRMIETIRHRPGRMLAECKRLATAIFKEEEQIK